MQRSTALTGIIAVFLLMAFAVYKVLPMAAGRTILLLGLALVIIQISLT